MGKPGNSWFSVTHKPAQDGHDRAGAMFQGETAITIDDKGRLAIPTGYRDLVARECGNRLVITYNPFEAGCLYLYPQPVWERVRDQVNALPRTKQRQPQPAAEAGRRGDVRRARRQRPHQHSRQPPQRGGHREEGGAAGHGRQVRVVERAGAPRADPADARRTPTWATGCSTCSCDAPVARMPRSAHLPVLFAQVMEGLRVMADGTLPRWHVRARRTCARRAATTWAREGGCC